MKLNDIYDTEIIDNGSNFEGIAKIDGITTFIDDAIISEKVRLKIKKVTSSYTQAKILDIYEKSKYRQDPICEVFGKCGGCSCQHMDYNFVLNQKKKIVENVLSKQRVEYKVLNNCIGMGMPYYYRNKVQYPIRIDSFGKNKIGFYQKNSHDIIENKCCYIQDRVIDIVAKDIFNKLIELGFDGYNEEKNIGDIRHIVVRRGYHTSEIMIILVVNNNDLFSDSRFLKLVNHIKLNKNIKSLVLNLNKSKTNEILGDKSKVIYGEEYISDYIGDFKFLISPKSFFQVNTTQAEVLYNTLLENLKLSGSEILFDLYSGVGSIGIFLSRSLKQVYGIEIEKEAVLMANENMRINNVQNCEYIAGSVEDKIVEFGQRSIKPDVIVVDPPRKGLDQKSIEYIMEFKPKKIGYVSCNPATLARDLKLLSERYDVLDVSPVDMFPQTSHVECVILLHRKK